MSCGVFGETLFEFEYIRIKLLAPMRFITAASKPLGSTRNVCPAISGWSCHSNVLDERLTIFRAFLAILDVSAMNRDWPLTRLFRWWCLSGTFASLKTFIVPVV